MKKLILTLIFGLFIVVVSVSAQTEYCFENKGLKTETIISFVVSGKNITDGEFQSAAYESTSSGEINHFVGTKAGNILTIKFTGTVPPDFSKIKKIVWTLGKTTLKVQMDGKNYNTNKWGIYSATYSKCSA